MVPFLFFPLIHFWFLGLFVGAAFLGVCLGTVVMGLGVGRLTACSRIEDISFSSLWREMSNPHLF